MYFIFKPVLLMFSTVLKFGKTVFIIIFSTVSAIF